MPQGHAFLAPGVGPVTAIPAWRVPPENRARAMARYAARGAVSSLSLDASEALYALCGLATGDEANPLRRLDNDAVVQAIDAALAAGSLLLFAGWTSGPNELPAGGADTEQTSQDLTLIDEVMRGSDALPFEGNRYRFVAAGGPRWSLDRREEQAIPADRAHAIVASMTERIARNAVERASWTALAERLTDEDRGDGIRLVRVVYAADPVVPEAESSAVTPSAARAAAKVDWVEISVLYEDGTPFTGNVVVELPDGRKTQGAPDENGVIRIDGLDPGSCKISIPDLDAGAWKQA